MGFGEPRSPAPTPDGTELLLGFLRWQREQVVAATAGLTDDQLWWTPEGRLLPIGGVVNHLTHMEHRWVECRYLGRPFPPRTDEFLRTEQTGAELVDAYWQQAQRTDETIRTAPDLEAPCLHDEGGRGPAHLLLGFDTPVTLHWLLIHLVDETAHHAGHADATRELLDGTKLRG